MKKIFSLISVLFATIFSFPVLVEAQGVNPPGLELDKWVEKTANEGKYNLVLEAFVTGESIQTITEKHVPTDIILVLDVSGSMDYDLTSFSYSPRSSQGYSYNGYGNNQYYYKDGDTYYQVSRTTGSIPGYTKLNSTSYTYEGYGSLKYYYKFTDDNYYLVSRGGGNGKRNLSFQVGNTKYYLSGTSITTTAPTGKGRNDTIWTGVLYSQSNTPCYRLSYNKNGTTYYLTSSGTTTTAPIDITSNSDTIWTGVLYQRQNSGTTTRLAALQEAVGKFIDVIAADADEYNVDHKIGVVKFASAPKNGNITYYGSESSIAEGDHKSGSYNYTEVVKQLKDVSVSTNVTELKTAVNALTAGGATASDLGMTKAKYALGTKESGRQQVVVMFTDGQPTYGSSFSSDVANDAIGASGTLKSNGVIVYTVGVLSDSDLTTNTRNYMNGVSSNYPNATGINNLGTRVSEEKNYFMNASNAGELNDIFKSIAEASASGSASIELGSATTTVIDILTTDFSLPEGATKDNITVQTVAATGGEGTTDSPFTFDDAHPSSFTANIVLGQDDDGNDKISVSNFDFSKADTWSDDNSRIVAYGNWVGPRTWGGNTYVKGCKLRITIPIELQAGYSGGYDDYTNTTDSGIYVEGNDEPIGRFPVPHLDYPSIAIVKSGLKKGENAIFSVLRTGKPKTNSSGEIIYDAQGYPEIEALTGTTAYTVTLTGVDDSGSEVHAILKDVPEGQYKITEQTWSWAYDVTNPTSGTYVQKILCRKVVDDDFTGTEFNGVLFDGIKCVIFNFENDPKENTPDHAEAIVTNDFKAGNATTVTSKTQPATN